ncbi:DUF5606 domain-containing protein [Mucilaginibacter mali]|uniref:DUF5606 domain-containing protein n=1 Tax=Mucilaginibacter mali TaxID=2740462 RepID=A0A7D4TQQ4_9SPHI|nr:DUF5606 domain-containing protein [Mucilaginibacter mali]QKJ31554.1 DUF5606 domain-containing protein [Mucilaginibacter mali]
MNLQGIVAVSGKPGLWKALTQNKTGFVLESLDEKRTKMVANISTAKLAALDEITIFGDDEDIRLKDVFERMKTAGAAPDAKADGNKLRTFFREVAPGHDEEKVYASDMKKIVSWFGILKDMPLFNEADPAEASATEEAAPVVVEETTAVEDNVEEKTTAKKKAAAKKPAK